MKLAFPWEEIMSYPNRKFVFYRRYTLDKLPLVEILCEEGTGRCRTSHYTFQIRFDAIKHDHGQSISMEEAVKYLDGELVRLGWDLITEERAEKLRLLL